MTNAEKNTKLLNEIARDSVRGKILNGIAKHYGTDVAAIEAELIDDDAELVFEYMVDTELRMTVYNMMKGNNLL